MSEPIKDTDRTLRLVNAAESEIYDLMRAPESTAQRVQRLQREARALALEQVEALEAALITAANLAHDIATGGDAYPVGAREIAARLTDELPSKAETIKVIVSKTGL